jgi:DNA-directed RNA polymerase alpha subunit
MQYPHWLMVAGAVLVVVGFIGLAFRKNNGEPAENNLKQEAAAYDELLPDDTPISDVELPSRIRKALVAAGLETVGEVRETADETLLSFQDLGKSSVAHIRETLGSPSTDGVRPSDKKPA